MSNEGGYLKCHMYKTLSKEVRLLNIISPWLMGKSAGKKKIRDETWSAEG